jgi:hypothetical protein
MLLPLALWATDMPPASLAAKLHHAFLRLFTALFTAIASGAAFGYTVRIMFLFVTSSMS